MWTETSNNGKKRVCERYKDPLTGKWKTKSQVIEKDTPQGYKNAVYKLNQKIELALKENNIIKDITFFDLCDLYLNYKKLLISETEIDTNEHKGKITEQRYLMIQSMVKSLKQKIKDFLLNQLNIITYNNILNSTNKKVGHHIIINEIINFGYKQELIKSRSFISAPISNKNKITDKFLEHNEVIELFNMDLPIPKFKIIQILIETGMRIGELLALNINDIQVFEENNKVYYSINISKTYSTVIKRILSNTKNKKSRTIGINKDTYENLIFLNNISNRNEIVDFSYASVLNFLKKIKLSTNKKLTPHIFRHTSASILFEMGYDLDTISYRLGDNSETIKRIYLHIRKIKQKNEIKVFNNINILEFEKNINE